MGGLEEHGAIFTSREGRRLVVRQAGRDAGARNTTANVVARGERHRIAGLADRDGELVKTEGPERSRVVAIAVERELEKRPAASHVNGMARPVVDDDLCGHRRSRRQRPRRHLNLN